VYGVKLFKKISSIVTMTALVLSLIMPANVNATIVTSNNSMNSIGATMDSHLLEEMKNNSGLLNVIVTFKGDDAPTNKNVNLLKTLGIDTGITMQSLPIAGVLATAEQVKALQESDQVRSLYLNRKVEFYNADATELTGVNKVRNDNDMRVANGGLPV
jgi:serine protease AprX